MCLQKSLVRSILKEQRPSLLMWRSVTFKCHGIHVSLRLDFLVSHHIFHANKLTQSLWRNVYCIYQSQIASETCRWRAEVRPTVMQKSTVQVYISIWELCRSDHTEAYPSPRHCTNHDVIYNMSDLIFIYKEGAHRPSTSNKSTAMLFFIAVFLSQLYNFK